MNTILNECRTLYLDRLFYSESLELYVSEGFISDEKHSIQVGGTTIENVQPMGRREFSRQYKVEFQFHDLINFQVINESYTGLVKSEIVDTKGFLQIILNSEYLKYVEISHGWYKIANGGKEGKHYRLWTEDEVIDIISINDPTVEQIK
ncbi:MAG: hypothetical protein R2809_08190 [Flavobacteriales bacterium]